MINVSNAFKNELFNDNRNYLEFVDIMLADGTKLNLTNKDLWDGGLSIDDAVSTDNSFDVGSAIINKLTVAIENLDDRFSDYDFNRANVEVYIGLALPDGTKEKMRKGVFSVDEAKYNGSVINLSCLDNMSKFDKVYSESNLSYPATLNQIIRNACDVCDVTLQTYNFAHDNFVVQTRPVDEATTFREVVAWCAQIAGCFARCDKQGRLELKWYDQELLEKVGLDGGIFDKVSPDRYTTGDDADGGSFKPWDEGDSYDGGTFRDAEGYHHIYANYSAPVLSTDDVVITGVRILEKVPTENGQEAIETYLRGSEGYVVEISNNNLIQGGNGLKIADWLGKQLIGFKFRKAQLSHASDPTIEAGDVGFVTDRKQRSYPIIISSTRFNMNGAQTTNSSAADPIKNSGVRFSAQTKNYVESRRMVEQEKTDREKALEKLGERIDNSSGLYTTEKTQPDGSMVFYMHDKPALEESMIVWEMTAEAWSVSTDGGDTWNAGVTVDGDTIVRILTAVGINAEWINAGQLTVRDGKGNVTFLADCNTGKVEIVADKFSLSSGKTIESIAEDKASSAVNDFISATYSSQIAELQKQLDGQIESFYYDYAPDLNKAPSNEWQTETDKQKHEGDLFFDKSTGLAYRFFKDSSAGWTWQLIKDNDIAKALADASKAQDTADHKRRVFVVTPEPPYDVGDLWVQGEKGDILRCKTAKTSGAYALADWIKASKYTDDSALNTFINDTYTVKVNELETQADKKAETWYQATNPGENWSSAEKTEHTGDLWYNTADQKTYIYNGAGWDETKTTPPDAVFDRIDGKAQIFINTPKPPYREGDLWFNSATSDIMTCIKERTSGGFLQSEWEKRNKYIDKTAAENAASDAVDGQTQEFIFGKLTNGGKEQGVYLKDGKLYINGTYIVVGKVSSKNGKVYFDLDNNELSCNTLRSSKPFSSTTGLDPKEIIIDIGYEGDLQSGYISRAQIYRNGNEEYGVYIDPYPSSTPVAVGGTSFEYGQICSMEEMRIECIKDASYATTNYSFINLDDGDVTIGITNKTKSNPLIDISSNHNSITLSSNYVYIGTGKTGGEVNTYGAFTSYGKKNRAVNTENYGTRLQSCYEMPVPMFGDIGMGVTDENGDCYIFFDDIFLETVATQIEYQVFLQKEGDGDLFVAEKKQAYFVVHGTPNLKFAWEVKAKQIDYAYDRLESVDREANYDTEVLETAAILDADYEKFIKEQEELLYETT